jgi:hypothetical protein
MHSPSLCTVSAPNDAALAALLGNFSDGDRSYTPQGGGRVYRDALPTIEPIGTVASAVGGFWVPEAAETSALVSTMTFETAQPVVPGRVVYKLPVGNYVAADVNDLQVFHNGFELQWGPDWFFQFPGLNNPTLGAAFYAQPPSVQDVASGVSLNVPAVAGVITLRWVERTLAIRPSMIIPTTFTGTPKVAEPTFAWNSNTDMQTPNGIVVPQGPFDCVPEIWRKTKDQGGRGRGPTAGGITFYGLGSHFVPYFRGPQANVVDPNAVVLVERLGGDAIQGFPPFMAFGAGRKMKFRVCYYSPSLRARSAFATEMITMYGIPGGGVKPSGDRHNGAPAGTFRARGTISVAHS